MTPQEATTAIFGGQELTVRKRDPAAAPEIVLVRQLPIGLMRRYAACIDDEGRMVDLLCAKPDGWNESLENDSFEEIVSIGERLNESPFLRWLNRTRARAERVSPGITEKIASQIGSPNSASKPD